MHAEIVAIVLCSAASSFATYELVKRKFSALSTSLTEQFNSIEPLVKKYAQALDASAKTRAEELKNTHVVTIAKQVDAALQYRAVQVKICSVCGNPVVKFTEDGDTVVCKNCGRKVKK